jgi:hypothetical protein
VDHSSYVLEFTRDGTFHLSQNGIVKRTAHYRFNERGDVVLYDINPPLVIDHREEADAQCRYTILITKDGFSVTDRGWELEEVWRGPDRRPAGLPFLIAGKDFKRVQ